MSLPDVDDEKPNEEDKVYHPAVVYKNKTRINRNIALDIEEAKAYIIDTKLINKTFRGGSMYEQVGIYTSNQAHAKALALALEVGAERGLPQVQTSGQFGHYHDKNHTVHIWFGTHVIYK